MDSILRGNGILKVFHLFCEMNTSRKLIKSFEDFANSEVVIEIDLPKSYCKKEKDDLSLTAHSWIIQLDGRTVFGTAGGTFDHNL